MGSRSLVSPTLHTEAGWWVLPGRGQPHCWVAPLPSFPSSRILKGFGREEVGGGDGIWYVGWVAQVDLTGGERGYSRITESIER